MLGRELLRSESMRGGACCALGRAGKSCTPNAPPGRAPRSQLGGNGAERMTGLASCSASWLCALCPLGAAAASSHAWHMVPRDQLFARDAHRAGRRSKKLPSRQGCATLRSGYCDSSPTELSSPTDAPALRPQQRQHKRQTRRHPSQATLPLCPSRLQPPMPAASPSGPCLAMRRARGCWCRPQRQPRPLPLPHLTSAFGQCLRCPRPPDWMVHGHLGSRKPCSVAGGGHHWRATGRCGLTTCCH